MRTRALLLGLSLSVVFAAAALAAGPLATLSLSPNKAGKGSTVTLDITPPKAGQNPRSITLRVAKGAQFDGRALAAKCTTAQANANKCPSKSRFGGGTAKATVTSTSKPPLFPPTKVTLQVDLFLAAPQKAGDKAGVVAHFKVKSTGQQGHVIGRVFAINSAKYGLETFYDNLDTALKPPAGTKAHIDKMHLTYGTHRIVKKNGKDVRYDLIKNPKTCNGSWPYEVTLGYRTSGPADYKAAVACTK
jgi:hypothetical protein